MAAKFVINTPRAPKNRPPAKLPKGVAFFGVIKSVLVLAVTISLIVVLPTSPTRKSSPLKITFPVIVCNVT